MKAKTIFNKVVDNFMEAYLRMPRDVNKTTDRNELENKTFFQIRDSRAEEHLTLRYSADRVFAILTHLGWFTQLSFDSNSDLRALRPGSTINSSMLQSPRNYEMSVEVKCDDKEELVIDEVEAEAQKTQLEASSLGSLFPAEFEDTIAWAYGNRSLELNFKYFVEVYSNWKDRHTNAMLLNVKSGSQIEVMSMEDPHIA